MLAGPQQRLGWKEVVGGGVKMDACSQRKSREGDTNAGSGAE